MSTITIPRKKILTRLGEHGEHWTQGAYSTGDLVCLHGAIRECCPQPGDAYLIEQVAARQGWGTSWNDANGTTFEQVAAKVRAVSVTDADLADTFGPQWEPVVALVRRAAVLTGDEVTQLAAARDAAGAAAWGAARDAARGAARDAARAAAWGAARVAAWALVTRDLIGERFTQEHYDTLTRPWRIVIGPLHPDDAPLAAAAPPIEQDAPAPFTQEETTDG